MRTTLPCLTFVALLLGPSACAASSPRAAASYGSTEIVTASAAPMANRSSGYGGSGDYAPASAAEASGGVTFASHEESDAPAAVPAAAPAPPPPPQAPAPSGGAPRPAGKPAPPGSPKAPASGEVSAVRAPMLIYSAEVTMAVFEVTAALAKVEALAKETGGFLARRDDATIVIRVPAGRFDEALKRIETFGDMLHRNVGAEDVTEEFLDLEVRMRNARAVRDRLEKLLEKAAKVEESIQLERELERVAGEIERLEGRMKYLRDRAAFSTITVLFQPRRVEAVSPGGPRLPVDWLNELGLGRLLNL